MTDFLGVAEIRAFFQLDDRLFQVQRHRCTGRLLVQLQTVHGFQREVGKNHPKALPRCRCKFSNTYEYEVVSSQSVNDHVLPTHEAFSSRNSFVAHKERALPVPSRVRTRQHMFRAEREVGSPVRRPGTIHIGFFSLTLRCSKQTPSPPQHTHTHTRTHARTHTY